MALAIWGDATTSQAGDPATAGADALISRGVELRRAGRDEEALKVFRDAYALSPSRRALAQIALAEQATGQWVGAEVDLAAALKAEDDPWIARNTPALTRALQVVRSHVGQLMITGAPAGAIVQLNGKAAATLPLAAPLHLAAGEVLVTVAAPGYESIRRKVVATGGDLIRETIELPRLAPASDAKSCGGGVPLFTFEQPAPGASIRSDPFTAFKSFEFTNARSWCSPGALRINAAFDLLGQRNALGRLPNQAGQMILALGKHLDMTGKTVTARVYVDGPVGASFGVVLSAVQKDVLVGGRFFSPLAPGSWHTVTASYTAENHLYYGGTSRVDDVSAVAIEVDVLGPAAQRTWSGTVFVDDIAVGD